MELSGSTTANWVAKTANLLVDALGAPPRVGLLLPLHWQTVVVLLGAVTSGASVLLARAPRELAGCDAAFVRAEHAEEALAAGVDEVLGLSGHPLGAPTDGLPGLVLDYAREVPGHGDHFGGPAPVRPVVTMGAGAAVVPLDRFSPQDRVLTTLAPADPPGAAVLLGALGAGAGLVLLRAGEVSAVAAAEKVTSTAGVDVQGLTRTA